MPFPHGTAGRHHGGGILRRAQPPFNLDAGHPGVHQLPQTGNVVHIFQAQVAGFSRLAGSQPGGGVKGQTAGPCAGAAVAAAPAQEGTHHALAADAHAQRPVDEHLALDGAGGADRPNLLQGQFPGQDHPVVPQGRQFPGPGGGVYAHLGGPVQMQRGGDGLDQSGGSQVVGNNGVCSGLGHGAHSVGQAVQFPGVDQGVQRHVDPHAPGMAERDCLPQFFRGEIARRAAGVEAGKPQINSISAAEHSGAKHFAVARGG